MLRQVLNRLRNASPKITKRTVARTAFRRRLIVESLQDRRLLAVGSAEWLDQFGASSSLASVSATNQ